MKRRPPVPVALACWLEELGIGDQPMREYGVDRFLALGPDERVVALRRMKRRVA